LDWGGSTLDPGKGELINNIAIQNDLPWGES